MARTDNPLVPPHPTPTADSQLVANLNTLIELERGVRAACYAAAQHLHTDLLLDAAHDLAEHSTAAIGALSRHVELLGGLPPDEASARELLHNNATMLRELTDRDEIVRALQGAADELEAGYANALDIDLRRVPIHVLACVREFRSRLAETMTALRAQVH